MIDVVRQRLPVEDLARSSALEEVVAALAVGVGLSTEDGRLVEVNDALLDLLGCSRQAALGRTIDELVGSDLAVSRGADGVDRRVRTFERADGRRTWVRMTVSHVRAGDGRSLLTVHSLEDLTDLKIVEGELRERALMDPVTGLPNRYLLQDRLEHALAGRARGGPEVAVVFVDLDGFKSVNDTVGHQAGDDVLREVGRRIAACGRMSDTVARWAGDEFVVLLDGVADPLVAQLFADRVASAVAEPLSVGAQVVSLGASVGVALTSGREPLDPAELLDQADRAMYADKRRRRG